MSLCTNFVSRYGFNFQAYNLMHAVQNFTWSRYGFCCWAHYPVKVWANAILLVDSPECLAVRLTDHSKHTATTAWWAHWLISQIGHYKLMVWDANSWRTHKKVTAARSSHECIVSWLSGFKMSLPWGFLWTCSVLAVSSNSSLGL